MLGDTVILLLVVVGLFVNRVLVSVAIASGWCCLLSAVASSRKLSPMVVVCLLSNRLALSVLGGLSSRLPVTSIGCGVWGVHVESVFKYSLGSGCTNCMVVP